jgi:hypothetical protein
VPLCRSAAFGFFTSLLPLRFWLIGIVGGNLEKQFLRAFVHLFRQAGIVGDLLEDRALEFEGVLPN